MREDIRYCPVSMGSEIVADRWTPMILRELLLGHTRSTISPAVCPEYLGHCSYGA